MELPVLRRRPSPVAPTLCLAVTLALASGPPGAVWASSHKHPSKAAHQTSAKTPKKSAIKSKKAATPKATPAKAAKPAVEDDHSSLVAEADETKPATRSETSPPAAEPAPAFAAEQGTPIPPDEEASAPEPTADEVAADDLGRRKAAQRLLRLGVSLDWRKSTLAELKQTERDLLRAGDDGDARVRIIVAARLREEGVNVDWRRLTSDQLVKMYVAVSHAPVTSDLYAEAAPAEPAPAPTYADGYADGQAVYAQQQQQIQQQPQADVYYQEPVYVPQPVYVSSGPVVIVGGNNNCPPERRPGGRPGQYHHGNGNGNGNGNGYGHGNVTCPPPVPMRPSLGGVGPVPLPGVGPVPTPGIGPIKIGGGVGPTFTPRVMPGPVPLNGQPTNLSSVPRQAPGVVVRPSTTPNIVQSVRYVNGQRVQ